MFMKKFMMSVPNEMYEDIEKEMRIRRLDSVQETIRQIISAHLKSQNGKTGVD